MCVEPCSVDLWAFIMTEGNSKGDLSGVYIDLLMPRGPNVPEKGEARNR